MKKLMIGLTALMLMLSGLVCAWAEEAPVLLVQLPEDAQMVENVAFDDGDFVQTYQLNGGAYVQLLRYGDMSMSIGDLVAGDRAGATSVQDMELDQIGGCTASGVRLNYDENGQDALRVSLVLVTAGKTTLVYQAVYPQKLGEEQIDATVDQMVRSMDVLDDSAQTQDVG